MPEPDTLPESIRDIVYRQATAVDSQADFDAHMTRLLRNVDAILGLAIDDERSRHRAISSRIIAAISSGVVIAGVAASAIYLSQQPKQYRIASEEQRPEHAYHDYSSKELGVTFKYPFDVVSLNTMDRLHGKLTLITSEGVPLITIKRTYLPTVTDVRLAQQIEIADLRSRGYEPSYAAPEKEENWSNWYVISGVKRGRVFYYRRWNAEDSVVSIEFDFPAEQKVMFNPIIDTMTRQLSFTPRRPNAS
jgi:hypothetical protein